MSKKKRVVLEGEIEKTRSGYGFLRVDDGEDVFIAKNHTKDAMDGDLVEVELLPPPLWKKGPEGFVVKVTKRALTEVVGRLSLGSRSGFVIPQNSKIRDDIFVPRTKLRGAKNGDRVIVKINKYPKEGRLAEGEIKEVFAKAGEKGGDIKGIILEYGLSEAFPPEVEKDASESLKVLAYEDQSLNRRDLRDLQVITIDGAISKDLDDGVSLEILSNGNYKLGVHIADVSHFVRENTLLDQEAFNRGNSVYLLDRVVPMLPKILSNGICSLNEHVDRLTLSCFMEINQKGEIVDYQIVESIINSKGRLVYDHVSDYLEEGTIDKSVENHLDLLKNMEKLALLLKKKREADGSIDFDIAEAEIQLDKNGIPVDVYVEERRIGNKIIEEFMLAANKTVAEHYFWLEAPFVYRVHENPEPEKVIELKAFLKGLGLNLPMNAGNLHPKALTRVLDEARVDGKLSIVNSVMVRSMQKAFYSPECTGHYGLAFKYYCHFTSPIRRYPDLIIHRIIKAYLNGSMDRKELKHFSKAAEEASVRSSFTERQAIQMERRVEKMKKAEYMEQWVGYEATGVISGVTRFGFFVELENTIEGLVRTDTMLDDFYELDEKNYRLVGISSRRTYSLGDQVDIVVVAADKEAGTIDFNLAY